MTTRLAVYVSGLAVAFAGAFAVGGLTGDPVGTPTEPHATGGHDPAAEPADHGEPDRSAPGHDEPGHEPAGAGPAGAHVTGLQTSAEGYHLSPVEAPGSTAEPGTLSFQIVDPHGEPVTSFTESHEQLLHLIVVRSDTGHYQHVHPVLGADGTWTVDWQWPAAGSYRVFADFTPAALGEGLTLSRTVEVAGDYRPSAPRPATMVADVGGFTVTLDGDLRAGASSAVIATVARDGEPVADLEHYLGALGHLVALREGDLAYVHVHPEHHGHGPDDHPGQIAFSVEAPTVGTYRLFLEFQVAGEVHTAEFTVDASPS